MDLQLKNKTALVFGAGGGLGSAIAQSLAAEGVNIVAADIDGGAAEVTAERIKTEGGSSIALPWDIGDLSVIPQRFADIETTYGTVDILVNNTGAAADAGLRAVTRRLVEIFRHDGALGHLCD